MVTDKRFHVLDITHNRKNDVYCVYVRDSLLDVLIVAEYIVIRPTLDDIKQQLSLYAQMQPSQFYALSRFAKEYQQYCDH